MKLKFFIVILNTTKKDRIRNANVKLELGLDEIKKLIEKIKLVWTCNKDERKNDTLENNRGKTTNKKIQNQMY